MHSSPVPALADTCKCRFPASGPRHSKGADHSLFLIKYGTKIGARFKGAAGYIYLASPRVSHPADVHAIGSYVWPWYTIQKPLHCVKEQNLLFSQDHCWLFRHNRRYVFLPDTRKGTKHICGIWGHNASVCGHIAEPQLPWGVWKWSENTSFAVGQYFQTLELEDGWFWCL